MSQEQWIRLAVFLAMLINITISAYHRRKADQSNEKTSFEEENPTLLKLRNFGALLMYGSILAFLAYPRLIAWSQVELSPVILWCAVAVLYLLIPIFYWMFSHLSKNITPSVTIRTEHQLVTSGPYKYIRHPLYTFGFIMIITVCIASASWWILGLALLTWIPLILRTPLEKHKLIQAFGDEYREYIKQTGLYLPKLG